MDINFIELLSPEEHLLQYAGGKIKDFLKTREEYQKFEEVFVGIGKDLCAYEADGSELYQKLSSAFSASNMEKLADIAYQGDALMWQKLVESHLKMCCNREEISAKDTDDYVAKAMLLFKHRLAKQYPQFLQLIMLDELSKEVRVSGERNEEHYKTLEQMSGSLVSDVKHIIDRLEELRSETLTGERACEATESTAADFESMMRGIPVSEDEEWVLESRKTYGFSASPQMRVKQRKELTQLWAREREKYPGYYILSYPKAEELRYKTSGHEMFQTDSREGADDMLDFAYEYCWRWKHAMFIISAYDCRQLFRFFEEYEEKLQEETERNAEKLYRWFYIGYCLLGDAREELDVSKWNSIYAALEAQLDQVGVYKDELKELLWIEHVKMMFYRMQLVEVLRQIRQNGVGVKSFPVRLQMAGMLAECGEVKEAAKLLQSLECEIIQKVDSHVPDEKEQRFLLSLLSCAYELHKMILLAFEWCGNEEEECPAIPTDRKGLDDYFSLEHELDHVQGGMLKWLYDTDRKKATTFDVGRETVTIFGMGAPVCEGAYYLYRLMDCLALPMEIWNTYHLPKTVIYYMQNAVFQMCPMLGFYLLLRGDNKDYIKRHFNHQFLAQRSENEVHAMLDWLLKAFRFNLYEFKNHTGDIRQNQFSILLENGIELLYRLASRCAPYQYTELLEIVAELVNENCVKDFGAMDRLITYVFQYVPESKKAEYMNLFLGTAILHRTPVGRKSQVDIFEMLNRNEATTHYFEEACVNDHYIDELLDRRISNPAEDMVRLERLIELYRFHKLQQEQIEKFTSLLWKRRSEIHGLPDIPDRYMFSFLELPSPTDVNVLELIKKALLNCKWRDKLDKDGHVITMGNVRYFQEIIGLCNYFDKKGQICFTGEEAYCLIKDFDEYWKENKERIKSAPKGREDVAKEFVRRFEKMQSVIAVVLKCCGEDKKDEIKACVMAMYADMHECGIASVYVKLLVGDKEEQANCMEEILDVLYKGEKTASALNGAYDVLTSHLQSPESEEEFMIQILRIARTAKEKGLASLLVMLHNLFYSRKVAFSAEALKETGKVLENILCQFHYTECLNEKQTKNAVLIRHFAALLANQVHQYCEAKQIPEPESVGEWQKICSGDEFMDVKNAWLNP